MDIEEESRNSTPGYKYLRRAVLEHRYDILGRVIVALVFAVAIVLFVSSPQEPEGWEDYREWMIAFSVALGGVFLASMVSSLMVARIVMEELDSLQRQIRRLHEDGTSVDLEAQRAKQGKHS